MPIDSSKFNSPILKRIAEGDLSVVNDINEDNNNITEDIDYYGTYTPLILASERGHIAVVEKLLAKNSDGSYEFLSVIQNIAIYGNSALRISAENGHIDVLKRLLSRNDDGSYEFPEVIQNIAIYDNYALHKSAENGHIDVLKRLLARNDDGSYEFPEVIQNIAANYNHALSWAAFNGHIDVVKRLLAKNSDGSYEFEDVIQNIAANNNGALRWAVYYDHFEISYILTRGQWPNSIKDIPWQLREYIPTIIQGMIIANEQEEALQEATQLFRWLQVGYIPTSRKDLYLPPRLSSKELQETTTIPFDVMNIVNEYAGNQRCIDTSRPTNEELTMISIKGINLLKTSSSIMSSLEKARVEREENEHSCNEQALIPYSGLELN